MIKKEGIEKDILNTVTIVQNIYDKTNLEMAELLHGVADHFEWYEKEGRE